MTVPIVHLSKEATQRILTRSEELKLKLQELRLARSVQAKPAAPSKPCNS